MRGSLPYLDGSRIDFVKDGLKQAFAFDNPNVANACGCGESFSLKEAPVHGNEQRHFKTWSISRTSTASSPTSSRTSRRRG